MWVGCASTSGIRHIPQKTNSDQIVTLPPPVVLTAEDFQVPGRVGPFSKGMAARDAAALCLPPTWVARAVEGSVDAFGRLMPTESNFLCRVQFNGITYKLIVFFGVGQVENLWLELGELSPKTKQGWVEQVDGLLALMKKLRPASPLQMLEMRDGWGEPLENLPISGMILSQMQQATNRTLDLTVSYLDFPDVYLTASAHVSLKIDLSGSGRTLWEQWKNSEKQREEKAETVSPGQPVVVPFDPARDPRLDRVGPFVYGMPIVQAARLCGKTLSTQGKKATTVDLIGESMPRPIFRAACCGASGCWRPHCFLSARDWRRYICTLPGQTHFKNRTRANGFVRPMRCLGC